MGCCRVSGRSVVPLHQRGPETSHPGLYPVKIYREPAGLPVLPALKYHDAVTLRGVLGIQAEDSSGAR